MVKAMQQENQHNHQWHVCGLVVQAKPTQVTFVMETLRAVAHTEIPTFDEQTGKIVVVMQSENHQTLLENMENVRNIEGVLAVSLVYHELDLGD